MANGEIINVSSSALDQNQWWFYQTSQLPTAALVCSAIDPSVCTITSANGWVTDDAGAGSSIRIVVNDPYNATWVITWNYLSFTNLGGWYLITGPVYQYYIISGTGSSTVYLNPPYTPIQINMRASLASDPDGYACQVQPYYISNTYSAGSAININVNCTQVNETCFSIPVLFGDFPPPPPICFPPLPP